MNTKLQVHLFLNSSLRFRDGFAASRPGRSWQHNGQSARPGLAGAGPGAPSSTQDALEGSGREAGETPMSVIEGEGQTRRVLPSAELAPPWDMQSANTWQLPSPDPLPVTCPLSAAGFSEVPVPHV